MSDGIHNLPQATPRSQEGPNAIPAHYAQAPPPDPNVFAMPIFMVGSIALGLSLVGFIPKAAEGALVPMAMLATGLGLFFVCIWSAWLRRSFDAMVPGLYAGFWLSYGLLSLGLIHHWFAIPKADVTNVNELFMLTWAIVLTLTIIGSVRTTIVFTAFLSMVELAVVLILTNDYVPSVPLSDAAGAAVFAFCAAGAYIFVASTQAVFGYQSVPMGKPLPLGRPLVGANQTAAGKHGRAA